jgi:hypothetical protein
MPYVPTEPGALPAHTGGTAALLRQQEHALSAEAIRDKQMDYLAEQISRLQDAMPTPEEREWLAQRTRDAKNLEWLRAKIRTHAPWLVPVAGVIGAAFVWFSHNTINIVGKP